MRQAVRAAGALALGLVIVASVLRADRDRHGAWAAPAGAATKQAATTYSARSLRHSVAVFALRRLPYFTIRRGELRLGRTRQRVTRSALRAGARRGVLRVRLSRRLLAASRRRADGHRRPTLVVRTAGPLVPAHGALLGAWHRVPDERWSARRVAQFEQTIGRRLGIDHHYHAWGTDYWPSTDIEGDDLAKGRVPMLSLGGQPEFPGLDAINNGSQDPFLRAAALRVRHFRAPLFFRPLWEMNGDWSLWDGTHNNARGQTDGPAKYVAAWRRMHDIFAREGAANAVWVWAPNCTDQPQAAWNHWSRYYPGDAYVDWVACDGYNRGSTAEWSEWEPFARIFGGRPSVYGDYRRKPFMVAETASCEEGGSKVAWLQNARRQIKTAFPNIKALVWFDAQHECDWRVTSSRASLRAFRAVAADPYFKP